VSRLGRRFLALVATALLVAGAAGCASKKIYGEGASTVNGRAGELFVVELASNPTTGYSWMLVAQPDPTVATLMETDYAVSSSSALGQGGGHQRWTFRLVSPGSTTITFGYGRTWENAPAQKATMFSVTVR
jgi:inhibitor of cysteine peptidase